MQRVLIVGSGGAGKSTLARRLGARTGLPVVHLDACYWHAGWIETPSDTWRSTVATLAAEARWIMDGNYGGTLDARLAACDTVVFLDVPRLVCLSRVVRRALRYRGRSRPDMAPGCPERLAWEFVRWIWDYPVRRRQDILRRLAVLPPTVRVERLRTTIDVDRFLQSVPVAADHVPNA